MNRVLIIGATSAIAEAVARIYAKRGAHLHLIARNTVRLGAIADDLRARGAGAVSVTVRDLDVLESHRETIDSAICALGNQLDVALIAHGVLPNQTRCEQDIDALAAQFRTNAVSPASLLEALASDARVARGTVLGVISSVAGDRGRASNYAYGAAKALVTTYASGMRQRLYERGVTVLAIKPGFVDTPMTAAFPKSALWTSPAHAAAAIVRALDARRDVVYIPGFWRLVLAVIKFVPESLFKRLRL
jgi:decaprenylphospho-beta-D-erythro-pentofuranosid-2-ulose 2-reductase